ncbi:6189_t:CDS:1, partial [Dentiscutata erythropus]
QARRGDSKGSWLEEPSSISDYIQKMYKYLHIAFDFRLVYRPPHW